MENASKALIIAGAILISILLISIGILLINSGQDTLNSGTITMSSQAIQTFNSQFTQYEGSNKSTAVINHLLDTVISSNASYDNQVIVKLTNLDTSYVPGGVIDSAFFYVKDRRTDRVIRCSSSTIKTLTEIKSTLNEYFNNKNFNVDFHYFAENTYAYEEINAIPRMYFCNRNSLNKINKKVFIYKK